MQFILILVEAAKMVHEAAVAKNSPGWSLHVLLRQLHGLAVDVDLSLGSRGQKLTEKRIFVVLACHLPVLIAE